MTLHQLLDAHPKAVAAIAAQIESPEWGKADFSPRSIGEWGYSEDIRRYCRLRGIGSPLDPIASLLSAIEERLAADASLTDEQIEGMKWAPENDRTIVLSWCGHQFWCFTTSNECRRRLLGSHEECVNALLAEIRRLRAEVGRKESPDAR